MANGREWGGVDSLIGGGCRVEGAVVFRGGLRVDGQIAGDVLAEPTAGGCLMLSVPGRIEGDVRAEHIVISGEVIGNLHATGRVELLSRARIIGNISYASLSMQAGARVSGALCPQETATWPADSPAALRASSYNPGPLVQKAGVLT
jgi:cytoskeletal protein CcmA (bactofilin family)